MKKVGIINIDIPDTDVYIDYLSDSSLRDYDIIVLYPTFPPLERIYFSGGGSCIDIESGSRLTKAMQHWHIELTDAMKSGKTIFVLLSRTTEDGVVVGYTTPRKDHRTYNTRTVNNYSVLPIRLNLRNATGIRIKVAQGAYRDLHQTIKDIAEYKVIINSALSQRIFLTYDGRDAVGGVIKNDESSGHLVLLPHFDFHDLVEDGEEGEIWSAEAANIASRIIGQLIAIDNVLRLEADATPRPGWIESMHLPDGVRDIDCTINEIDSEITQLVQLRQQKVSEREQLQKYQALMYENGKILEKAIEDSLALLGYRAVNARNDDFEMDHVIVGPSGLRMIGESEGKDNSAIDITKFRQLESNINEDFDRGDIDTPAKGILFGNGYRLTEPSKRENEFTSKCLINAKRLGTALVRTRDLYDVIVRILDNPEDDAFREKCRCAIESTEGDVVNFPTSS